MPGSGVNPRPLTANSSGSLVASASPTPPLGTVNASHLADSTTAATTARPATASAAAARTATNAQFVALLRRLNEKLRFLHHGLTHVAIPEQTRRALDQTLTLCSEIWKAYPRSIDKNRARVPKGAKNPSMSLRELREQAAHGLLSLPGLPANKPELPRTTSFGTDGELYRAGSSNASLFRVPPKATHGTRETQTLIEAAEFDSIVEQANQFSAEKEIGRRAKPYLGRLLHRQSPRGNPSQSKQDGGGKGEVIPSVKHPTTTALLNTVATQMGAEGCILWRLRRWTKGLKREDRGVEDLDSGGPPLGEILVPVGFGVGDSTELEDFKAKHIGKKCNTNVIWGTYCTGILYNFVDQEPNSEDPTYVKEALERLSTPRGAPTRSPPTPWVRKRVGSGLYVPLPPGGHTPVTAVLEILNKQSPGSGLKAQTGRDLTRLGDFFGEMGLGLGEQGSSKASTPSTGSVKGKEGAVPHRKLEPFSEDDEAWAAQLAPVLTSVMNSIWKDDPEQMQPTAPKRSVVLPQLNCVYRTSAEARAVQVNHLLNQEIPISRLGAAPLQEVFSYISNLQQCWQKSLGEVLRLQKSFYEKEKELREVRILANKQPTLYANEAERAWEEWVKVNVPMPTNTARRTPQAPRSARPATSRPLAPTQ